MARHDLVNLVLSFVATNWDADNFPTGNGAADATPLLIDRDEAAVYEITQSGTAEVGDATVGTTFQSRKVSFDLTRNNVIGVDSSPDRTPTPIGTEYDHKVSDAAHVRIEGANEAEFGYVEDAEEFEDLVDEFRRTVAVERVWPYRNPDGDVHYHTLVFENPRNHTSEDGDYYRYDVDVRFRGFEELP